MKNGGRLKMYELLNLIPPPIQNKPKPKTVTKLIIDRDGKNDKARYTGLKLGQILDDNIQGEVLLNVQNKIKAGEEIRTKLIEETYELPFADKRNITPKNWTPDWTIERLDDWGIQQGKAQSWARKARDGEFIQDPNETYNLQLNQRIYSIITTLIITISFGNSTPEFLINISKLFISLDDVNIFLNIIKIPAITLLIISIGSSILCTIEAPKKNRNQLIWFIKGILGGPFTIQYLQELTSLITQGEQDINDKNDRNNNEKNLLKM